MPRASPVQHRGDVALQQRHQQRVDRRGQRQQAIGGDGREKPAEELYFSRQFFSPLNEINAPGTAQQNAELQQGAYAKVNATLAWTMGRITLKGFVNNAFNRKTYVYGLDLRGAGFPYPFLVPAAPRTFGGSVRVDF